MSVVDLHSKILDARAPLGVQILSISCSFWGNLAKSYVGAPPGELAPPPQGNPGSTTVCIHLDVMKKLSSHVFNKSVLIPALSSVLTSLTKRD